ncbi:MAG: regulatory protein ArsR [Labilithrix sp.]|nr:regulatory protein ArsR [Labilithrix sp.]
MTVRHAVSELARPFDMALPSFMQHLRVLEDCGLVRSAKSGRVRTYRVSPEPLTVAEAWMADQRMLWNERLDQLDEYLEALEHEPVRKTIKKKKAKDTR